MPLFEAQVAGAACEDRRALVFLHGFTGCHAEWNGVVEALLGAARVLAFDLPGHGASSARRADECTMERATQYVAQALDAAAALRGCLLAGYSLGGRLALHVALALPEYVDALLLESASPGIADDAQRAARRNDDARLATMLEEGRFEEFLRHWASLPVVASYERLLDEERRRRLHAARARAHPLGLAASLRGMGTGSQSWLGERLAELARPVTLISGRRDEKFTRFARAMAGVEALPRLSPLARARLCVVAGAAHNVHLTHPAEFVAALRAGMLQ